LEQELELIAANGNGTFGKDVSGEAT
jgi:hypothetical protein